MATKKKIVIDREKCIGCGLCVNACPGGALQMVDGKAAVVREDYCDGLGACIGECPVDAISFEEVQTTPAAPAAPATPTPSGAAHTARAGHGGACPSAMNRLFNRQPNSKNVTESKNNASQANTPSELKSWPIQLHLVRPEAPQFAGADVLIAASCTAFALGGFHAELLAGRGLIIACPKLDSTEGYLEKLTELFTSAAPHSVTVARMEVPCCRGLMMLAEQARQAADSDIPLREVVVSLEGHIINERTLERI